MPDTTEVLYLDRQAIEGLALGTRPALSSLELVLREHAAGGTATRPKTILDISAGHSFQSLSAAARQLGYAMNKWFGMAPRTGAGTTANIDAIVALNDYASGRLLALMDGNSITALRTAAMSTLAARYLADPGSRNIAFVGCGAQARSHLAALRDLLPSLDTLHAYSASGRSAQALCEHARGLGMRATACVQPRDAVAAGDVVVSSVPMSAGFRPFLDPAWLKPGALVCAVDVGRSWLPETLGSLDLRITDDLAQAHIQSLASGPIPTLDFQADLAQLVVQDSPRPPGDTRRCLFSFHGLALADLAIAAALYEQARAAGTGRALGR